MKYQVAIIGGGIAGLTTAIAFQKAGYTATVFESSPTLRPVGAGLGLAANAIKALDKLGIKEKTIAKGRILDSFTIADERGKTISYTDSMKVSQEHGLDNFAIHRAALHEVLLNEIPEDCLYTGRKAIDLTVTEDNRTHRVLFSDGSNCDADHVIVADGIHSSLRQKLVPNSRPRYAGYTCWRAVVDNSRLNISKSYEIWGPKGRFGVVPLAGNQLYWFATINSAANNTLFRNYTTTDLTKWFDGYPMKTGEIIRSASNEALIWNDIIDLEPLPRYAFGQVLLIGDAAHATTPNLGQGACQAIEGAAVLHDELTRGGDIPSVFQRFEKRRLKRTHFITNQSAQIGKIAQSANPLIIKLRNTVLRSIPSGIKDKQLRKIYHTDF